MDISRVVRADGQETEDAGNTASGNSYSVIDYESNYGALLKNRRRGSDIQAVGTAVCPRGDRSFIRGMQPGWENLWNR